MGVNRDVDIRPKGVRLEVEKSKEQRLPVNKSGYLDERQRETLEGSQVEAINVIGPRRAPHRQT